MQYKDLKLKEIRDACGLDFAHFTYLKGQCSCCFGPFDMPARYWRHSDKPTEVLDKAGWYSFTRKKELVHESSISYILFKNSYNGSGTVKGTDEIRNCDYVSYHFVSDEQKDKVCQMLADRLGGEFLVFKPRRSDITVYICKKAFYESRGCGSRPRDDKDYTVVLPQNLNKGE